MAASPSSPFVPHNNFVGPLLTDMYQITMCYAYWKNETHEQAAVFDMYFRKCPFKGEFAVFAGLEECLRFIASFAFKASEIAFVKTLLPKAEPEFFTWLASLNMSAVKIYALREGTVVFPPTPVLRCEGPLACIQLLETPLLNLFNYATLVATCAARMRVAAGPSKNLFEFGCRRAQGPDGAVSASRYAYLGGFDGTSHVLAGFLFGMPVLGTHAHSFVTSFSDNDTAPQLLVDSSGVERDFAGLVNKYRSELGYSGTNNSELVAFMAYAVAFPTGFLALVDTYDTLTSGVPNFLCVALALYELGYEARGIRLDSGDLAALSRSARAVFLNIEEKFGLKDFGGGKGFGRAMNIVASNDIDEEALHALNAAKHEVDSFGIGTNLVTCKAQPALGGVFKLVEIEGRPRIKLSQDIEKVTIPGRKTAYRLYGVSGEPLLDVLLSAEEPAPQVGVQMAARHPFAYTKRVTVEPSRVECLHELVWDGQLTQPVPNLAEARAFAMEGLARMRPSVTRSSAPSKYDVFVSPALYRFTHDLWEKEAPVQALL